MMRYALALLLLASACSDDNNRLDTNGADIAKIKADLVALQVQVGAIPMAADPTMAIKSLSDRVAVLEAGHAAKAPHLLAYAGTDKEIDLGVSLGRLTAWDAVAGIAIDYSAPSAMSFMSPDCKGTPLIGSNFDHVSPVFYFAYDGRLIRRAAPDRINAVDGSTWDGSGCSNAQSVSGFPAFVSSVVRPQPSDYDIDIAAR